MPPATTVVRSHLELAPLPTAPGCARGHVRAVLLEWDLSDLSDTAELVTSELVTNAILASPEGAPVEVQVTREAEGSVLISVWDASGEMPVLQDASPGDESGRGPDAGGLPGQRMGSLTTHPRQERSSGHGSAVTELPYRMPERRALRDDLNSTWRKYPGTQPRNATEKTPWTPSTRPPSPPGRPPPSAPPRFCQRNANFFSTH